MDFDWNDSEDVVIPQVDAIAVYENNGGGITIRQRGAMGEEDVIISIPKSFIPVLIKSLENAAST